MAEDRVVVTFDADIPTLVAISGAARPSVVHLRTKSAAPAFISMLVVKTLTAFAEDLAQGAILVVEDDRNRIRALPIDLDLGGV